MDLQVNFNNDIFDIIIKHSNAYTCAKLACVSTNMKKEVLKNKHYKNASTQEFPIHYLMSIAIRELHLYKYRKKYHKISILSSYLPPGTDSDNYTEYFPITCSKYM